LLFYSPVSPRIASLFRRKEVLHIIIHEAVVVELRILFDLRFGSTAFHYGFSAGRFTGPSIVEDLGNIKTQK
jgi:hypothetical protein